MIKIFIFSYFFYVLLIFLYDNILKIKQFPEVEKCKVIQHLKNEIRIIGDEFKTNGDV